MPGLKEMMAEANAAVPRLEPAKAAEMIKGADAVILDVRDAPELEAGGKIKGAIHVSRGMLEFRADPESPALHPALSKDKTIFVYCASGGRSALAGKTLRDLGYSKVYNIGGFQDWAKAGLPTEPA